MGHSKAGNLFIQAFMPRLDNCGSETQGIQSNDIVTINLRKQIIFGAKFCRVMVVVMLSALVAAMRVVLVWHGWKVQEGSSWRQTGTNGP